MEYTHYYRYQLSGAVYAAAWPRILDDTARIIHRVEQDGIRIAGPHGHGRPLLDGEDGLHLDGDAAAHANFTTFSLMAPMPDVGCTVVADASCTTGRRPYDVVVAAVLLRCRLLLPDQFHIASDGGWDGEWAHGARHRQDGQTTDPLSARAVVARLFGALPAGSPLVARLDPWAGRR
jgi:hypothetical protein